MKTRLGCAALVALPLSLASADRLTGQEVLVELPIDSLDIIARDRAAFDAEITSDGTGSIRIRADGPVVIPLYEVVDIDIEDARIVYQARLRTEDLDGQAYLEMWCRFPELGEYFSRALHSPLSGTTDWTTQATPFFLEAGQNPDLIRLNVVIAGRGTVWVDDISLSRWPRG
jgi:hypothetical protein